MTSIRLKVRRDRNIYTGGRIQAKGLPPKDAIRDFFAKIHVLQNRIREIGLINKYVVLNISDESEVVLAIRFRPHDLRNEALVKVDVTDVHDGTSGIGAVGEDGAIDMGDDVNMDGGAVVEAGELRDHLDVAGGVGRGHTTEEGHV